MKQHRREINSHPKHKDIAIRLYLRNGTTETLTLKSNIFYHFKRAWRQALSGRSGHVEIHSENGKLFHKTFEQLRREFVQVIQIL